jgi:uncharacterized protein (DUF983 family)
MKRPLLVMIRRGWRRRCPVCGRGDLYRVWTALVAECSHCGTPLARREGDIYFMVYATIALLTGVFLLTTITILLNQGFYQHYKPFIWTVLAVGLFSSIMATSRHRKGVAVALDCYMEGLRPRED